MLKLWTSSVVLLIMTAAVGTANAQNTNVKPTVPAGKPVTTTPVVTTPPVAEPLTTEDDEDEIEDLIEDEMDAEMGAMGMTSNCYPASDIYPVWNNNLVNPYNQGAFYDTVAIALNGFNFPLKKFYRVNSEFGQRRRRYHYGIDLKIERGDTVVSCFDGMVRIAKDIKSRKGYGKYVVVRHYNGLETVYGHLDNVLVDIDQPVKAGEVIGLAGNTGRSTGPHLHYELRYQGRPINPRDIVNFDAHLLMVKNDTLSLTAAYFNYPKKSTKVAARKTTTTKATLAKASSGKSKNTSNSNGIWVVRAGDTLARIAQRTSTSLNLLCRLNGISTRSTLKIGQKIKY